MISKVLRQRAAALVSATDSGAADGGYTLEEAIHELRIRDVALDLQYEQLRVQTGYAKRARERCAELFELAPIAYIVVGRRGVVAEANTAAERLLAAHERPVVGATLSAFVAERDVRALALAIRDAFARDAADPLDLTLLGDGPPVPVRLDIHRLQSARPEDRALVAIVDRSEVSASETRRRQTEDLFWSAVDSVDIGALRIDTRGIIVEASPSICESLGCAKQELTGRAIDELVHPDDSAGAAPLWRSSERVEHDARFIRKDGEIVWWQVTAAWARDGLGKEWSRVALVRDVTDRMEAAERARATAQLIARLVDTAPAAIMIMDPRGRIVRFNPYVEQLTGYELEDVRESDWFTTFLPRHEQDQMRVMFRSVLQGAEVRDNVSRLITKDGRTRILQWSSSVLTRADGTVEGVLSVGLDITEREHAQHQLRQAQKLEAIGTLASGVAHDFNNLLMGVDGCASVALDTAGTSSAVRIYLDEIRKSAKSGASIAKQLLAFTRKSKLELTVFELNSVVSSNVAMLRRLLGEDIELAIDLRAPDSRVRGDVGQLEQVLLNLAVNARDAMPRGGRLTLATDLRTFPTDTPARARGEYVVLVVADSGCGMSDETRNRLFEPFFSTKSAGRGTGLGLSTVYGIVTGARGHIEVTSALGQGARFEVFLPLSRERTTQEIPAVPEPASPVAAEGETVLMLEDDRLVRLALRHYLETAGYRVLDASTGAEAVACCRAYTGRIDLLLSDVILPGGNGDDAAREIRNLRPDIEVLYMTAHDSAWLQRERGFERGVEVLQKPFDHPELLERVRLLLDAAGTELGAPRVLEARDRARRTVLVAEDDTPVRHALCECLRDLGYRVIEAATGEEAIRAGRVHRELLDALIVDVVLPTHMGVAVARTLEAEIPGLTIVFMSGYPREAALHDALEGTECLFVAKPVEAQAIHELLERSRANATSNGNQRSV